MRWIQFALLQILAENDTTRIYVEPDGHGDEATANVTGTLKIDHRDLKEMAQREWIEIDRNGLLVILNDGAIAMGMACNRFGKAMSLLERAIATEMPAPDKTWFLEYFALTGEHMILTDEGWTTGKDKDLFESEEILAEVNAPLFVYQMNDCDSMAARSPAEALQAYAEMQGYKTIEELVRDGAVDNEIVEKSLDDEMWVDLSDKDLGKTTFRAVIEERAARGDREPFFIASTEY